MKTNVKKDASRRGRRVWPVWLWVVAVVVSFGGCWLGLVWVERYIDVKNDHGAKCFTEVGVRPEVVELWTGYVLVVRCTREPDALLWKERVVVSAFSSRWRAPDELAQPGDVRSVPLSQVKSVDDGGRVVVRGDAVDTKFSREELMAAVRAGGALVRPYEGRTWLIARGCMVCVFLAIGVVGAPIGLVRGVRAARRASRVKAWRCVGCGYDLGGLAFGTRCPECGEGDAWGRGGNEAGG